MILSLLIIHETGIEESGNSFLVEMLADKDKFLHTVAVVLVPVATQVRLASHQFFQFVFWHSGIPESRIFQLHLTTCLFEKIAGVTLRLEITDTLATDDILRPQTGHEMIKASQIHRCAALPYKSADAIFLRLTFIMMVMMVMVVFVPLVFMFMLMFMLIKVMVIVIVVIIVIVIMMTLESLYPSGRGGHLLKIEETRIKEVIEIHIAVIAFYDAGVRLQILYDSTDATKLLFGHIAGLIEKYQVTELYLLNHEVFNILLVNRGFQQVVAAVEFILHTQGIYNCGNAVELRHTAFCVLRSHSGDGTYRLSNGGWLADAACLDDDIIKLSNGHNVVKLLNEVHLQRTADAAVLKRHERIVCLIHHPILLDEGCIDVHLTDIVDNNGKTYAATIVENTIEKCCLTTAEITRKKQYRYFFHSYKSLIRAQKYKIKVKRQK